MHSFDPYLIRYITEFLKQCGNCKCFDIPNTMGVNTCEMCRTYHCNKCDNQLQNITY